MPAEVDILMPVYNAERYLESAVRSILDQTFRDFRLIVLNDGSTDGSPAIVERLARQDTRIHIISRPNTGILGALNDLLGAATAPLVARMDADDLALPHRLARQVAFMHANPEVVLLGCQYEIIDGRNRRLFAPRRHTDDGPLQAEALGGVTPVVHPCAMFRLDAARAAGGYDPAAEYAEDLDLWLKLGEMGRIANLPEVLMLYREHDNSVSSQNRELQLTRMRQVCEQAWTRRRIEGRFLLTDHWRPGPSAGERSWFFASRGALSWGMGRWRTPVEYALKALRERPVSRPAWKLLLAALVLPRSRPAPNLLRKHD